MHLAAFLMPFVFGILSLLAATTFAVPLTSNLAASRRSEPGQCAISSATLPMRGSPPELPSPPTNLHLKYVTLGLGVQKYTCNPGVAPASAGAAAALFDISCIYKDDRKIRGITESSLGDNGGKPRSVDDIKKRMKDTLPLLADHYFISGAPFFDFRPYGHPEEATVTVATRVPSPSGNDIDWLQLTKTSSHGIEMVYRVKTYGGKPAADCHGQVEVPYAAQYWFYG